MGLQVFSKKWGDTPTTTVDLQHKPKVVKAKVKSRIVLYSRTRRIDSHVLQDGKEDKGT